MLKFMFKGRSGSSTYIDINGRPWHKRSVLDYVSPDILTGGVATSLCAVFACISDPGRAYVMIGAGLAGTILGTALCELLFLYFTTPDFKREGESIRNFAIDTSGKAAPPRTLPDLLAQTESLQDMSFRTGWFFSVVFIAWYHNDVAQAVFTMMNNTIPGTGITGTTVLALSILARASTTWLRCLKIVNGIYIYCGTPPEKPQKATTAVPAATAQPVS